MLPYALPCVVEVHTRVYSTLSTHAPCGRRAGAPSEVCGDALAAQQGGWAGGLEGAKARSYADLLTALPAEVGVVLEAWHTGHNPRYTPAGFSAEYQAMNQRDAPRPRRQPRPTPPSRSTSTGPRPRASMPSPACSACSPRPALAPLFPNFYLGCLGG